MAWTNPPTWVTLALLTAAELNTYVRDNLKFLFGPPQCAAYHNTTQNVNTATLQALALNSERYDRVSGSASTMHDNAVNNSRIIPNQAGIYGVNGSLQYPGQAAAAGIRSLYLRVNGTTYIGGVTLPMTASYNSTLVDLCIFRQWEFNGTTDYVELVALHTAGVTLTIAASAGSGCELALVRLG